MASIVESSGVITVTDYTSGVTLSDIAAASGITVLTEAGNGSYLCTGQLVIVNSILNMTDVSLYHQFTSSAFGNKPIDIQSTSEWVMLRSSYIFDGNNTGGATLEQFGDGNTFSGSANWQASFFRVVSSEGDSLFNRMYNDGSGNTWVVKNCLFTGGMGGRIGGPGAEYDNNYHIGQEPLQIFLEAGSFSGNIIDSASTSFVWNIANSRNVTVRDIKGTNLSVAAVTVQPNSAGAGTYTANFIDFDTSPYVRTMDIQGTGSGSAWGTVRWKYTYQPTFFEGITPLENVRMALYNSSDTELFNKLSDSNGEVTASETEHSNVLVYDNNTTTVTNNGPFTTVFAKYGYKTQSGLWEGTSRNLFASFLTANSFVVAAEATAAAYTGITVNSGAGTVTISGTRTIQEVYDYLQDWYADNPSPDYTEVLSTTNGTDFTIDSNWSFIITGSLSDETKTISGTLSVSSGGFYEDMNGAIWENGGSVYYGKHFYRHIQEVGTLTDIEGAVIAMIDSSNVDRTYSTALVNGAVTTDVNGDAEGYMVYKIDSTTYTVQEFIGKYAYRWSILPRLSNGTPIGASGNPADISLVVDGDAILSESAALAISGVTVNHTTKIVDMNDNSVTNVHDNLMARQASTSDIETGKPGYISYAEESDLIEVIGGNYEINTNWQFNNYSDTTDSTSNGAIGIDTPGVLNIKVEDLTIDLQTAGTYDFRGGALAGTVELINTSGGSVTVQVDPTVVYVNTGPNITVEASIAVSITAPNLVDGTRVYLYNTTQDAALDNSIVSGGSGYTFNGTFGLGEELEDGDTITLKAAYQSGLTAKLPVVTTGSITSGGLSFTNTQEDDDIYVRIGIDGATQDSSNGGPLTADFTNVQIDVNDVSNTFDARYGIAWWRYITQTSAGIAQYNINALEYNPDEYNVLVNGSLQIENVNSNTLTIFNGIWIRADANSIIASTSNTIHWIPDGRVYVAETGTSGLTPTESAQLAAIAADSTECLKLKEWIALR